MSPSSKFLTFCLAILFLVGCSPSSPAGNTPISPDVSASSPTPLAPSPSPTNTPAGWGIVSVVNSMLIKDNWGDYQVVGLIFNGTRQSIQGVHLNLQAADSAGNSVLQTYSGGSWIPVDGREFHPLSQMIPAGGYAPFAEVINSGIPASFTVEVANYTDSSSELAAILVENAQMFFDGDGDYFISGEVVNTASFTVHLENVTGVVLDDAGDVTAAAEAWAYAGYLLPTGDPSGLDRAPFSMQIFGPLRGYTGYAVYPLAFRDAPAEEIAYTVNPVHTFVSNLDDYHVIAQATSLTTSQIATFEVLAALYDENGLVIDVDKLYLTPSLKPGDTGYVDVYRFKAINAMPELISQIQTVKVQMNPESILTTSSMNLLGVQGVTRQYFDFGPSWFFTGQVVNNTGAPVGGATVMVTVFDAENNLVGTGFAYVSSSGDIPAGGTKKFEVSVTLDPALDPAKLTYKLIAWDD